MLFCYQKSAQIIALSRSLLWLKLSYFCKIFAVHNVICDSVLIFSLQLQL